MNTAGKPALRLLPLQRGPYLIHCHNTTDLGSYDLKMAFLKEPDIREP